MERPVVDKQPSLFEGVASPTPPYPLPAGWRWVRLGEACSINPRRPRIDLDRNEPTTFVPMAAVDEDTGEIAADEIRPFEQVKRGYTYFEEGDVLFAKITPCMENGKAAIALGLLNGFGFGSTEFHVLRPGNALISEWVWLYVRQERFRELARTSFRGGVGQQRVPQEFLEDCLIPLPPLAEQRRIVAQVKALMERVREARRLRAEALADAERLLPAALAEVFPHPARPDTLLPAGWRWVRLGEVCEPTERRDPTKTPQALFFYVDIAGVDNTGGEIVSPKELLGKDAPSRARKVIRAGDVLFATTRPYLKNIAMVGMELDDQICSTGFCVLRAKREAVEPQFLFYLCRSDLVVAQLQGKSMRGASYPAVTDSDVLDCLIPLPPLAEQRRIVAYLDAIHEQVRALQKAQEAMGRELRRLEQAILERAFRGEL